MTWLLIDKTILVLFSKLDFLRHLISYDSAGQRLSDFLELFIIHAINVLHDFFLGSQAELRSAANSV